MNSSTINRLLQELQKTPFIESNVSHRITNDSEQVVSLTYCSEMERFKLHDIQENKIHQFADLEDTAAYLNRFINQ
ncbi:MULTISPECIES: hypothetical protein [Bacillus]|uniref:hypothetical protein n=1 Tax=Bacillus TaxID=1386 RepID=UPI000C7717BF|nr:MULTISPECIES: hypothetical protein [Bacillus]PLR81387.1 hypothetical protein CVD23_19065 [Bacillus sp. V33-4]RSK48601.1 hypothetical protein EJA13_16655 [Bacillus canaveralius]